MSHQMLDSLEGYLDNIAAAAMQTAATGTPLAELAASLAVLVDTVARKQLEIKRLTEHINALRKKTNRNGNATHPTIKFRLPHKMIHHAYLHKHTHWSGTYL